MSEITSMYDFECRIRLDARYKSLAIYAHETAGWEDESGTYEAAAKWISDWLKTDGNKDGCCDVMVGYLNWRATEMIEFRGNPRHRSKDLIIPKFGPKFRSYTCGCNLLLDEDGDQVGVNPYHKPRGTEA